MSGLINIGSGLSAMGQSISDGAMFAMKNELDNQKMVLASNLRGEQYDRASKAISLVPQANSVDAYLKATGHPGGLSDFGIDIHHLTGGGSAGGDSSAAPAPSGDAPPQGGGVINSAPDSGTGAGGAPNGDGSSGNAPAGQARQSSSGPVSDAAAAAFPKGAPVVTPVGSKGKVMGVPLPPGWTATQAAVAGPDALQKAWSEWSKPQNMRANSTLQYFDFSSGQMKTLTRNPEAPAGTYYNADTNSYVQIGGAKQAIADAARAKSYGESQGSLPADLTKIGATGEQSRTTASYQKGLDVATDLVPSYDPSTQSTTMITKADALRMARQGNGPTAPPDGSGKPIPATGGPGFQKDGSYKTTSGTTIPAAPSLPKGKGLQAAPSAADKATQESYAPIIKGWEDSVQPSALAEQRFLAIADAMKATQTGAWQATKQDIAHHLMSYGIIDGDGAKKLLGSDVGQAQIILKNNFGAALNTMASTHGLSRFTQNELFATQKNLPTIGNQPEANLAMIGQAVGTARWQQALANDWSSARQMGYSDPLSYQANWIKANPVQGFIDQATKEVGPLKGMSGAGTGGTPTMPAMGDRVPGKTTWTNPNGVTLDWTKDGWAPQ